MDPAKIIEKLTAFASNTDSTPEATNSMYASNSAYVDSESSTSDDYDTSDLNQDSEISSHYEDTESSSHNEGSESSSFDAENYDSAWRYQVTTFNELNVFEMADAVIPHSQEADEIPQNIAGCQVVRWGMCMNNLIRPGTIPASVEFLVLPITYKHSIAPSKLSPRTHVIVHISNIEYGPKDREFSVWSFNPAIEVLTEDYIQLDAKAQQESWVGFGSAGSPYFFLGVRYVPILPEVTETVSASTHESIKSVSTSPQEPTKSVSTSPQESIEPAVLTPLPVPIMTAEPPMTTPAEPVPTDEDDLQPHMCIDLRRGLDAVRRFFPSLRTNYGRWVRALTAADPINPDA